MAGLESRNSSIAIISFQRQDANQVQCCLSIPAQKDEASTSPPRAGENWKKNSYLLPATITSFRARITHVPGQSPGPSLPVLTSGLHRCTSGSEALLQVIRLPAGNEVRPCLLPRKGPATAPLSSIFSVCNWVGEPPASLISKTFDSSSLQYPSSCTPRPQRRSQMQTVKFSSSELS